MKKAISLFLTLALCRGLLAGCSNSSEPSGSSTPSGSVEPTGSQSGEKLHPTLNLRITSDITSLDPQVTTVNEEYCMFVQIFEGLVKFNGTKFEAVPLLATDWTISDDGLEYVFNLREGVKWHDGSDFTADDVVFTMNRAKEMPSTKSKAAVIKSAEALDEHTVKLTLEYAYPNFILQLASYPWCIVSKNAVETYGDDNDQMLIGTGAYKFVSNTTGVGVTLESNKDYWGGEPYFETINYKLIPDNNTALTALLNGEIDLDQVTTALDVDYVNNTDGMTVHSFQRTAAYFIAFNQAEAPLNNEYFRKAIAYAIDKEAWCSLVWNDLAVPVTKNTMLSEGEEGYCDAIPTYDYNIEKAKEMLELSGLSQDEMSFSLTVSTSGYGPALGAAFKEAMEAIGVNVTLSSLESGAVKTALFAGDIEACAWNLASIPYNPALFYKLYYKPTGYVGRNNTIEGLSEKIDEAGQTYDDATRIAMYEDISTQVGESCMYVPIAYQMMNYGCSENLQGMAWCPSILSDYICNWSWAE